MESKLEFSVNEIVIWGVIDFVLMLVIIAGNILTISALKLSRKLSAMLSNQFLFSLALSDIMVGLSLPYHYSFYLIIAMNYDKTWCILRFAFISLACSSSICNLLGTATDRYIAIVHPLQYSRYMTRQVAVIIICASWTVSFLLATVPIYWNSWQNDSVCALSAVLPVEYVSFVIMPFFGSVWTAMLVLYLRIWREAACHAKRMSQISNYQCAFSDTKSVQVVLLILGCFSICWLPYVTVLIFIQIKNSAPTLIYGLTFRMAVANSGMNPIIYAWKNPNFRAIFWCLLRCKSPNSRCYHSTFITNHIPNNNNNLKENEDFIELGRESGGDVIKELHM